MQSPVELCVAEPESDPDSDDPESEESVEPEADESEEAESEEAESEEAESEEAESEESDPDELDDSLEVAAPVVPVAPLVSKVVSVRPVSRDVLLESTKPVVPASPSTEAVSDKDRMLLSPVVPAGSASSHTFRLEHW